jgi:hypothetical protein
VDNDLLQEAVDRTRRIETRITKWLVAQGFETGVRRPTWSEAGAVEVPSISASLTDILATIPETWPSDEEVFVTFRGRCLGSVVKP